MKATYYIIILPNPFVQIEHPRDGIDDHYNNIIMMMTMFKSVISPSPLVQALPPNLGPPTDLATPLAGAAQSGEVGQAHGLDSCSQLGGLIIGAVGHT